MTKEKKESDDSGVIGILSLGSEPYCTADQCFAAQPQTFSSTVVIPAVPSWLGGIGNSTQIEQWFNLIPSEWVDLLSEAAQQGFLVSGLLTLTQQACTDFLKTKHLHPDQIYLINQGLRALLLVMLGTSVPAAIATPLASYVLHKCFGFSQQSSNYLTTGVLVGLNLLNSSELLESGATIISSVAGSIAGSQAARYGYKLARDAFFSYTAAKDTPDDSCQSPSLRMQ
ncbi:hypothetical protein Lbir_2981 [Legionella birminghamensis]|uniref:Uncharacterized protein n=1 Tax=Legionella birminghamensis TaxID=28083 RepID=A0A378I818_9GAMM|nr:hypothetical protein [Legionella birminghamensis]KTC68379.1 hypothetical protein Lbir_2981 [Legionella birminghamensis]STX30905.1 Uncharacterised protein [Legionella birminghamensis]